MIVALKTTGELVRVYCVAAYLYKEVSGERRWLHRDEFDIVDEED